MKNITFTSTVSTVVDFADRFQMDNLEFAKHIKHQMLAARTRRDVWGQELELRGLLSASYKYWSAVSRQMLMEICQEAIHTTDHRAFCAVFATKLPAMEEAYDLFSKKQAGVITALGASSAISSFVNLPIRTAAGASVWTGFTKGEFVNYLVGAAPYNRETRFSIDDARGVADWQHTVVDMAGLRALFSENDVGQRAWDSVYNSQFTKQRRKTLMDLDTVVTRQASNAWDMAVASLPERQRYNVTNGEVHHLFGALMRQFDFGAELALRTKERELEAKVAEHRRLYAGSADSAADWELGKDDFLGEELSRGMAVLQREHEELEAFVAQVESALHNSNEPLKAVHGGLSYLWIRKGDEYIKVEDKRQARILRQNAWEAKRDALAVLEWDRLSTERLAAIDEAMKASYLDGVPESEMKRDMVGRRGLAAEARLQKYMAKKGRA
jgi:hypothetical protein